MSWSSCLNSSWSSRSCSRRLYRLFHLRQARWLLKVPLAWRPCSLWALWEPSKGPLPVQHSQTMAQVMRLCAYQWCALDHHWSMDLEAYHHSFESYLQRGYSLHEQIYPCFPQLAMSLVHSLAVLCHLGSCWIPLLFFLILSNRLAQEISNLI